MTPTKYQEAIKQTRENTIERRARRQAKAHIEKPSGIYPPRQPGESDEDYSKSIAAELNRATANMNTGKRKGSRESFARAMRKLLRREDKAAEDRGFATEAVLVVVTVDPSKEDQPILKAELLRSTESDVGTVAILQAAGRVLEEDIRKRG